MKLLALARRSLPLAALCAAGAVHAQSLVPSHGLYLYGTLGYVSPGNDQATLDNSLASAGAAGFSSSLSAAGFGKVAVGMRINHNLAVEAAGFTSGNENYSAAGGNLSASINATSSVSGESVSLVGFLPLSYNFTAVGRVGVATTNLKLNISTAGYGTSSSASRTDATYGIGARWDLPTRAFVTMDVDSLAAGDANTGKSRLTTATFGLGLQF